MKFTNCTYIFIQVDINKSYVRAYINYLNNWFVKCRVIQNKDTNYILIIYSGDILKCYVLNSDKLSKTHNTR